MGRLKDRSDVGAKKGKGKNKIAVRKSLEVAEEYSRKALKGEDPLPKKSTSRSRQRLAKRMKKEELLQSAKLMLNSLKKKKMPTETIIEKTSWDDSDLDLAEEQDVKGASPFLRFLGTKFLVCNILYVPFLFQFGLH